MEKRGLVAMGLILLMLLLYQIFFITPKAPERAPQAEQGAAQVPAEVAKPSAAGSGPDSLAAAFSQAPADSQQAPEVTTVVETPLYVARFSSHGGALTSLRLAKFPGTDEKPVELVAGGAMRPLAMGLLTTTGERLDLGGAAFAVSGESLTRSGRTRNRA